LKGMTILDFYFQIRHFIKILKPILKVEDTKLQ